MELKKKLTEVIPSSIINRIAPCYYKYQLFKSAVLYKLIGEHKEPFNIPIVINNYNRLSYLERLINSLKERGYNNIYILDNDSTYPPLLDFYKRTDVKVIFLKKNWGFRAIWESGIVKKFWKSYYVYTDSDMELDDNCPNDFMSYFLELLEKYPQCHKVGFGLKLDDLPDYFSHKNQVIEHEKSFWQKEIAPHVYDAPIDTTFALYRPFTGTTTNSKKMNIRTGTPYLIKHLPWYVNSQNLSTEELYYINNVSTSTHWSEKNKQK